MSVKSVASKTGPQKRVPSSRTSIGRPSILVGISVSLVTETSQRRDSGDTAKRLTCDPAVLCKARGQVQLMLRLRLLTVMMRKALAPKDEDNTSADSRAAVGGPPPETGIIPMNYDFPMANIYLYKFLFHNQLRISITCPHRICFGCQHNWHCSREGVLITSRRRPPAPLRHPQIRLCQ